MDTKNRFFNFALGVILFSLLMALLTSCSPFDGLKMATPTAAAKPTMMVKSSQDITISPTPFPTCTVTTNVSAARLNVRSGASVHYGVIALLHEGQVLTLTGSQANGWIELIAGNLSGWINSKYCKE